MQVTSKPNNHLQFKNLKTLIFLMILLIVNACKKNEEPNFKRNDIQEGKDWFNAKMANQSLNTAMFRKQLSIPQQEANSIPTGADLPLNIEWENAKLYLANDSTIIEVPVSTRGIFQFNVEPLSDKKVSMDKSFTRVLIIKTPLKTEGYFMTVISSDEYLQKNNAKPFENTYQKKESDFGGTVIYHDLNGKLFNVVSFKKLKLTDKLASTTPTPKNKINRALPDDCSTGGTPVYQIIGVNCFDIGSYYTYCGSCIKYLHGQCMRRRKQQKQSKWTGRKWC